MQRTCRSDTCSKGYISEFQGGGTMVTKVTGLSRGYLPVPQDELLLLKVRNMMMITCGAPWLPQLSRFYSHYWVSFLSHGSHHFHQVLPGCSPPLCLSSAAARRLLPSGGRPTTLAGTMFSLQGCRLLPRVVWGPPCRSGPPSRRCERTLGIFSVRS